MTRLLIAGQRWRLGEKRADVGKRIGEIVPPDVVIPDGFFLETHVRGDDLWIFLPQDPDKARELFPGMSSRLEIAAGPRLYFTSGLRGSSICTPSTMKSYS